MRTRGPNLDLAGLPTGHDRLAPASADDLTAVSMCSDRTNTQMRSHLVRGADIGRGTRFVNQQEWGAPERTRPDRRGHVVRRADEALVDWRLATDRTPGPTARVPGPRRLAPGLSR